MTRLLIPALFTAALATTASAQVDYTFDINSVATNFTWSGTTSLGDIDEDPADFTLTGDNVMGLDTGGSPVGTGRFANAGDAKITPDISGEVPNPIPWLPPLAEFDLIDTHIRFSSPTFAVDSVGSFSTMVTVYVTSGTLVVDDILGNHTVFNLGGMFGDPEPTTGAIYWVNDHYQLTVPIHTAFDFDDPTTGISGTLDLLGTLYSDHYPTPPYAYCPGAPNSVGPGAVLSSTGSTSIGNADLWLHTTGLPANQFGLHFYGPTQMDIPFGNGTRCIGPPLVRLKPVHTGALGEMSDLIDNSLLPVGGTVVVGDTRNFQCWYRDPAAGGALFNLSNGLNVVFTP